MQFKNHEDQQAFELWAFGRTGVDYEIPLMHSWNSKHGNKVWLLSSETIQESLKKMYALYLESK
jgi:hypothetical protein